MATYLNDLRRDNAGGAAIDAEVINLETLEVEQCTILDRYVDAYMHILHGGDAEADLPPLLMNIDGMAGCGKTYLICAICQELRQMASAAGELDPIRMLAPSGVAPSTSSARHSTLLSPFWFQVLLYL